MKVLTYEVLNYPINLLYPALGLCPPDTIIEINLNEKKGKLRVFGR